MNAALSTAVRQCLEDLDVPRMRRLWKETHGNMPQPQGDAEILATMHYARTQAESIPFQGRAYSHSWLLDHGLPSALPDELKPRAQRLYPVIHEAVGIAVGFRSSMLKPAAPLVEKAMSDAVEDCYAEKRTNPDFVKARLTEARVSEMRRLFGRFDLLNK